MTTTLAGRALDRLGTYEAGTDAASTERIYAGDGRRVPRRADPQYMQNLTEALRLYDRVLAGDRRSGLDFAEAMSTSDFNFLFADIIDRQMLAAYQTMPVEWSAIARRGRVRDFRTVKRFTLDGGAARLAQVKELAPYTTRAVTDGAYSYAVVKYGAEIPISWESMVNDDLDALSELPATLGQAARQTEEYFATDMYAATTGPDGTFFSNTHLNLVNPTVLPGAATNPPLSIAALQSAMTIIGNQVDSDGGPIYIRSVVLVVPPALEVVANNIINATEILAASGGGDGTGNDQLRTANWMRNRMRVVVNPWLPIISTTNGNTSWYVFADPSVGRPAQEVGFLIGHETPELWVAAPNAMRVGGGMVGPEEGDFDHDAIRYRVRMVVGGTLMDFKSAAASNGSGA